MVKKRDQTRLILSAILSWVIDKVVFDIFSEIKSPQVQIKPTVIGETLVEGERIIANIHNYLNFALRLLSKYKRKHTILHIFFNAIENVSLAMCKSRLCLLGMCLQVVHFKIAKCYLCVFLKV